MTHVEIVDRQTDVDLEHFTPLIPSIVSTVLDMEKTACDHVAIQFLSDSTMRRYHAKFFNDPSSTDCMSFPLDEDPDAPMRCLGEILVCPRTALKYLTSHPETTTLRAELALYIVHGLLHLLGYDDIDPKDRAIMKEKEKSAMNLLHEKGIIDRPSI